VKCVSQEIANEFARTFLDGGEILVTVRGTLGGVAVAPVSLKGANISREVAMIPLLPELNAKFFTFVIASPIGQAWLSGVTQGIAYAGINIKDLKELPIAVPPLAEQQRIVAKVDELLRWCDALEARITAAQTTATHLLDATLHQILAA
jgi:type I restriction enzyme S subunit